MRSGEFVVSGILLEAAVSIAQVTETHEGNPNLRGDGGKCPSQFHHLRTCCCEYAAHAASAVNDDGDLHLGNLAATAQSERCRGRGRSTPAARLGTMCPHEGHVRMPAIPGGLVS